jgi:hypothetical protein
MRAIAENIVVFRILAEQIDFILFVCHENKTKLTE